MGIKIKVVIMKWQPPYLRINFNLNLKKTQQQPKKQQKQHDWMLDVNLLHKVDERIKWIK